MNEAVGNYLASLPPQRKLHVTALRKLVLELFPQADVNMKYKMPTYTVGEGWVAIANQKNYVSLYTCSATHLVKFKETCPQYKTGKGCINFRESNVLPIQELKSVIRHAIRHPKGELHKNW